jgi:hypothetical protein
MEKYTHKCPNLKPLRNWRFTAILFIALFVLAVAYFTVLLHNAREYEIKVEICAYSICDMKEGTYDAYFYSDVDDNCFCFLKGDMETITNVDFFIKHNSSSS